MGAPQLTDQVRKRLVALIAEDRPDGERLLRRLRELRTLEGVPACSEVVRLLTHLAFRDNEAESLLHDLLDHRRDISARVGRDLGLRVAALDYLSNVRPLLRNPAVVEASQLGRTQRSAITDALTEVYNLRYAQRALDIEVQRSGRSHRPLSVLMLDLDSFKSVNDLYGHAIGDLVLQSIAGVVRRTVRHSDLAARVGGEEFVVLLPETDRLGAFVTGERIRHAVEVHFEQTPVGERAIAMTVSGGVASYPGDGSDAASLLARAEQAVYQSKISGRNRVTIYHSERRQAVRYPTRPRAQLVLAAAGQGRVDARLVNLSLGGALIEPVGDPLPAAPVECVLERGAGPDCDQPLAVWGRVIRVESGGRTAIAFDRPLSQAGLARNVLSSAPSRTAEGRA